jgi:hypothetical protein
MERANNSLKPLSQNELMAVNGGGPISGPTLILGAFGVASAGIAIGLAVGAAYYFSTH